MAAPTRDFVVAHLLYGCTLHRVRECRRLGLVRCDAGALSRRCPHYAHRCVAAHHHAIAHTAPDCHPFGDFDTPRHTYAQRDAHRQHHSNSAASQQHPNPITHTPDGHSDVPNCHTLIPTTLPAASKLWADLSPVLRHESGRPRARLRPYGFVVSTAAILLFACAPARASATPTPVMVGTSVIAQEAPAVATSTPGPFQIELPARGAPPVTDWRPPLYPIPWAITPYDHFYFARPIAADEINWPLASYRYGGVFFENVVHTGVDIDAPYGTPILAAGPGTVVWADWGLFLETPGAIEDPYGMAVVVRMDFGHKDEPLYSVYAHMSEIIAIRGQHVETGDVLGLVGTTGATTGPHVHFEVRWANNSFHHTYNPELWMVPPEGWGVLVGQLTNSAGDFLHLLDVKVQNTVSGETRIVRTYGGGAVNPDPYYRREPGPERLACGPVQGLI